MKKHYTTTIILCITYLSISVNAQTLKEWKKIVIPEFESRVKKIPLIGASLCLAKDGKIVDFQAYGYIDNAKKVSNAKNTIFNWASITKTLTCTSIMQLRDQGKLNLDDPVVKYLPEFRWVKTDSIDIEEVKVRHLITHTSGIWRKKLWQYDNEYNSKNYRPTSWLQVAAILPYCKIVRKPGKKLVYSNFAYVLLGRIIENVTGEAYTNYVSKNIFSPLNMLTAHFGKSPVHLKKYKSFSYTRKTEDTTFTVIQPEHDRGAYNPAGGFYSSIPDLVKFVNFLCNIGNKREKERFGLVLNTSSIKEMLTPQIKIAEAQGQRLDMSLSFYMLRYNKKAIYYKDGVQFGFRSYVYFNPSTNTCAIIVFNSSSKKTNKQFIRLSQYDINARFFLSYKND